MKMTSRTSRPRTPSSLSILAASCRGRPCRIQSRAQVSALFLLAPAPPRPLHQQRCSRRRLRARALTRRAHSTTPSPLTRHQHQCTPFLPLHRRTRTVLSRPRRTATTRPTAMVSPATAERARRRPLWVLRSRRPARRSSSTRPSSTWTHAHARCPRADRCPVLRSPLPPTRPAMPFRHFRHCRRLPRHQTTGTDSCTCATPGPTLVLSGSTVSGHRSQTRSAPRAHMRAGQR